MLYLEEVDPMKLAQFYVPKQGIRTGVLQDERVQDLTELAPDIRTVNDLLERSRREGGSMEEIGTNPLFLTLSTDASTS